MKGFVIKKAGYLCDVCVPEKAALSTLTAAAELIRCLSAQCGAVPVLYSGKPKAGDICVGASSGGLGSDELHIAVRDDILWIDGGVRGVLYGVYELLERLGCRFFAKDCEVLPKAEELTVPAETDIRQKPLFEYRNTSWCPDPLLAPKLRLNGLVDDGEIPVAWGGGQKYLGFVHTLGELAEMELIDGEYTDRQPCLTDEKTYQTVIKNLRRKLEENPWATIASVSQNDSHEWARGCQCPRCKALDDAQGTPMGSLLTFVNRVAEELEPDYPQLAIDTLAYAYTSKVTSNLRARDNVIIRLCAPACSVTEPLEKASESFAQNLRDWAQKCSRIYIWDYTTCFLSYHNPFPNFNVLRQNVRFFADNNVRGVFEQGNHQTANGEFGELRAYLFGKLLWDPYMSEETYQRHIDEFMAAYYGPGAKHIRQFFDRLQNCAHGVTTVNFPDPAVLFLDPETKGSNDERAAAFLQKGRADFAAARSEADAVQSKHLLRAEIQLDLYEWHLLHDRMQAADDESKEALKQSLQQAGLRLYAHIIACDIVLTQEDIFHRSVFTKIVPYFTDLPYEWGTPSRYLNTAIVL